MALQAENLRVPFFISSFINLLRQISTLLSNEISTFSVKTAQIYLACTLIFRADISCLLLFKRRQKAVLHRDLCHLPISFFFFSLTLP